MKAGLLTLTLDGIGDARARPKQLVVGDGEAECARTVSLRSAPYPAF